MRWSLCRAHDQSSGKRATQTNNQVMRMASNGHPEERTMAIRLRRILLELARRQEEIAFAEAAVVPYWAPHPTSIGGHRTAAKALRSEADRFLEGS